MPRKAIRVLIILGYMLLTGASLFVLSVAFKDTEIKDGEQVTSRIRTEVVASPTPTPTPKVFVTEGTTQPLVEIDSNLLRSVDFDALQKINADAQRWVYIPDTIVDYYVMQEPVVGEAFYLHHDIYKKYYSPGCILTMKTPLELEDVHLILYGHHMINKDIAFGRLREDYGKKDAADEHPYIYVYYKDRAERWLVWAAVEGNQSDIVYETPLDRGSDRYQEMLDFVKDNALYEQCDAPDKWAKTLFLSTCRGSSAGQPERFYVVAVLDSTYYYETGKEWKGDYYNEDM